jgi:hypothetical protein
VACRLMSGSTGVRLGTCVILVMSCACLLASATAPVAARPKSKPAGTVIDVVFEDASATIGLAKHAYILVIKGSGPDPLVYKTEAVGDGKRDMLGIPVGMLALAPFRVVYQQQSARAKGAYDLRLTAPRPFEYYMYSFTQTAARVNKAHILYDMLGDNSNRYAYTALVWAGIRPMATLPLDVWVPGWGASFSCLSLHECATG